MSIGAAVRNARPFWRVRLTLMNIAAILREIDLEIERLHSIRVILRSLTDPAPRRLSKRRTRAKAQTAIETSAVVIASAPLMHSTSRVARFLA